RDDFEAHDALLAIASGSVIASDDRRRVTPDHYLRPPAEMFELFADLPEAIDNTVEIALRCSYFPQTRSPILPRFANCQPGEPADEAEMLRRAARAGLAMRLEKFGTAAGFTEQDYRDRLEYELGIIEGMKFPGYFLIVADFIQWAKSRGIPVGPGRGSGAG